MLYWGKNIFILSLSVYEWTCCILRQITDWSSLVSSLFCLTGEPLLSDITLVLNTEHSTIRPWHLQLRGPDCWKILLCLVPLRDIARRDDNSDADGLMIWQGVQQFHIYLPGASGTRIHWMSEARWVTGLIWHVADLYIHNWQWFSYSPMHRFQQAGGKGHLFSQLDTAGYWVWECQAHTLWPLFTFLWIYKQPFCEIWGYHRFLKHLWIALGGAEWGIQCWRNWFFAWCFVAS